MKLSATFSPKRPAVRVRASGIVALSYVRCVLTPGAYDLYHTGSSTVISGISGSSWKSIVSVYFAAFLAK